MAERKTPKRPRKPSVTVVTGTRAVESLAHFQCGTCRKWWSIGDAPARRQWFCPWCGEVNSFSNSK